MTCLLPAFTGTPNLNRIYNVDAFALLRALPDASVHSVVSSPPYWNLRDYNVRGQMGSEPLHDCLAWARGEPPCGKCFVCGLRALFVEIWRVLRDDGCVWLNLGDGYGSGEIGRHDSVQGRRIDGHAMTKKFTARQYGKLRTGLPSKSLLGSAWRVALALQADGWILRSDVIWHKPNGMPESVKDRPTRAHEYVFLLTRQPRYWFDLEPLKTPKKPDSRAREQRGVRINKMTAGAPGQVAHSLNKPRLRINKQDEYRLRRYTNFNARYESSTDDLAAPRDVWQIATAGTKDAHFATFPPELARRMILSSCPPKVCACCGMPYVRQTTRTFIPQGDVSPERGVKGANGQKQPSGDKRDAATRWHGYPRGTTQIKTLSWQPQCECEAEFVPGVVLDPFMGSGTVALDRQ